MLKKEGCLKLNLAKLRYLIKIFFFIRFH